MIWIDGWTSQLVDPSIPAIYRCQVSPWWNWLVGTYRIMWKASCVILKQSKFRFPCQNWSTWIYLDCLFIQFFSLFNILALVNLFFGSFQEQFRLCQQKQQKIKATEQFDRIQTWRIFRIFRVSSKKCQVLLQHWNISINNHGNLRVPLPMRGLFLRDYFSHHHPLTKTLVRPYDFLGWILHDTNVHLQSGLTPNSTRIRQSRYWWTWILPVLMPTRSLGEKVGKILGGGFKYFLFPPLFGEDSHVD